MNKAIDSIILCQPDSQKGCSACCGLFNFKKISKDHLSKFLKAFEERRDVSAKRDHLWNEKTAFKGIRDDTSHICPYQGFIARGKPGCLFHPKINGKCVRRRSLYGARVCNDFLCPAHYVLNDKQKQILIKYIDDWYLYTIAIIDPVSFIWIIETLRDKFDSDLSRDNRIALMRRALYSAIKIHLEYLKEIDTPIFHYSVSEYNQFKKRHSLISKRRKSVEERRRITDELVRILG